VNNTDLLELFRENLREDIDLGLSLEGPIVMGGWDTKHIATSFKTPVGEVGEPERWSRAAMVHLAQMVSSFTGGIQFYQLHDPLRNCPWQTIVDPEIEIREYTIFMKEKWSEPAEDLTEDQLLVFKPRMKNPDCRKTVFEVVIKFEQVLYANQEASDLIENPETD
jgi:hypothetical protein